MFVFAQTVSSRAVLAVPAPLQLGLGSLGDASPSVRALVAFLLSTLFGGIVLYRYGNRLPAAVETSMSNPLVSLVYGFVAYGLVAFFAGYAYSQVAQIGISSPLLGVGLTVVLGVLLAALGGVGFAVVGGWVAELVGLRDAWFGLVSTGLAAAAAVLVLPVVLGALVWFAVAAIGLGGPVKRWIHADTAERSRS